MAGQIIDKYNGVTEVYHKGHHRDKTFGVSYHEDVQPVLDANKDQINSSNENWKGDMHHVARVPESLIIQWSNELGDYILKPEYRPLLFAKLNDPAYAAVRTKKGRL